MRHALGRGMGAVGCAKGIVDIEFAERGKLMGKGRIVLLFFFVEAEIFQQQHLSRLQGFVLELRPLARHYLLPSTTGLPNNSLKRCSHGGQAHCIDDLSLWASQVRHQDEPQHHDRADTG